MFFLRTESDRKAVFIGELGGDRLDVGERGCDRLDLGELLSPRLLCVLLVEADRCLVSARMSSSCTFASGMVGGAAELSRSSTNFEHVMMGACARCFVHRNESGLFSC